MTPAEIEKKYFATRRGGALATLIRLVGDFRSCRRRAPGSFCGCAGGAGLRRNCPPIRGPWLVNVARNKAIDRIRREYLVFARKRPS